MTTPRVSVVVSAYNSAAYIEATMRSVAAQEFTDYEVLLVDDGSTDETIALAVAVMPDVTVIRQARQGVAVGRNRGVFRARGEWIAFLDGDDLWAPGHLRAMTGYLDAHPECEAVATSVVQFTASEDLDEMSRRGERVDAHAPAAGLEASVLEAASRRDDGYRAEVLTRGDLVASYPIRSPAFMIRRETLHAAGLFSASSSGISDLVCILNVASLAPVHLLRYPVGAGTVLYRMRAGSVSQHQDLGLALAAAAVAQHFGSMAGANHPDLDLLTRGSATQLDNLTRAVRATPRRGAGWRRRVILGLGMALLPRRRDRVALGRSLARRLLRG